MWTFEFLPSIFKKVILTGLSSLRQKRCLNSIWYFMILPKKTFFQNIKIKLNSNAWMTLKSSVVIFQALKPLQPQWPQWPQQPQWPQWPQQPHFIKKITDPDDLIIPSTQMTNTSPFLWNGSSKIQFFTDIWYSSWRGCWGQPMSFFWKLVDETQISKPPEATRHHNLIKLLILLLLKADLFCILHYETPSRISWYRKGVLTLLAYPT